LYSRPLSSEEVRIGLDFLRRAGEGGWEEYCQVLLCANEFAYANVLTPVVRLFAARSSGFPAHPSRTDNRPS
jgi:hypothetical protein